MSGESRLKKRKAINSIINTFEIVQIELSGKKRNDSV